MQEQSTPPEPTFTTLTTAVTVSIPTTSRRPRLADILSEVDLEDLYDERFDYMKAISNRDALNDIAAERALRNRERN